MEVYIISPDMIVISGPGIGTINIKTNTTYDGELTIPIDIPQTPYTLAVVTTTTGVSVIVYDDDHHEYQIINPVDGQITNVNSYTLPWTTKTPDAIDDLIDSIGATLDAYHDRYYTHELVLYSDSRRIFYKFVDNTYVDATTLEQYVPQSEPSQVGIIHDDNIVPFVVRTTTGVYLIEVRGDGKPLYTTSIMNNTEVGGLFRSYTTLSIPANLVDHSDDISSALVSNIAKLYLDTFTRRDIFSYNPSDAFIVYSNHNIFYTYFGTPSDAVTGEDILNSSIDTWIPIYFTSVPTGCVYIVSTKSSIYLISLQDIKMTIIGTVNIVNDIIDDHVFSAMNIKVPNFGSSGYLELPAPTAIQIRMMDILVQGNLPLSTYDESSHMPTQEQYASALISKLYNIPIPFPTYIGKWRYVPANIIQRVIASNEFLAFTVGAGYELSIIAKDNRVLFVQTINEKLYTVVRDEST